MRLAAPPRVELRYRVQFSAAETARLREINFLPPGPESEAEVPISLEELKQMHEIDPIFTQAESFTVFNSATSFTISGDLEDLIVRAHNRRATA